ncbi:MAG: hypothetical protein GY871_15595, partial [Actinomycetales bacterium]|nr:hypothetical protein [Actinomycetales bacterium]
IMDAIAAAPSGSIISLASGTYNEAVDFGSKNLVLQGDPSSPSSVVLDGAGLESSVVTIAGGQDASSVVTGITIRNGAFGNPLPGQPSTRVGGGLYVGNSSPVIQDCIFAFNTSGFGGGVYLRNGAAEIQFCSFLGNNAGSDGGAIFASSAGGFIGNCSVSLNGAGNHGGGIKVVQGDLEIIETQIVDNSAYQGGGLFWFASETTLPLRVTDCTITGNDASKIGGGIKARVGYPGVDLVGTTVCDNDPDEINGDFIDGGDNTICRCEADLTGDGLVSGADIGLLLVAWGPCIPGIDCNADLDGNGVVNGADLGLMLVGWGVCVDP